MLLLGLDMVCSRVYFLFLPDTTDLFLNIFILPSIWVEALRITSSYRWGNLGQICYLHFYFSMDIKPLTTDVPRWFPPVLRTDRYTGSAWRWQGTPQTLPLEELVHTGLEEEGLILCLGGRIYRFFFFFFEFSSFMPPASQDTCFAEQMSQPERVWTCPAALWASERKVGQQWEEAALVKAGRNGLSLN